MIDTPTPKAGDCWTHRNGNIYEVMCLTNLPDEPRYPTTVVYRNVNNGTLWSRPLSDWFRSFTPA